jgi:hypothetical protein
MAELTPRWLLVTLVLLFVLTVAFFVYLAYVLGPAARLDAAGSAALLIGPRGTQPCRLRAA